MHRYHIAVHFDVPSEHREAFIAAALEDGRESGRHEPGTGRFELIQDEENPDRFYLDESYADRAAFDAHCDGPYFKKFFAVIGAFAKGPVWLIRGTRIVDHAQHSAGKRDAGPLTVIAELHAKPGLLEHLQEELAQMITPSLAERGCRSYRPYVDATAPDTMIIVEEWENRSALERHFETPHFKRIGARLADLLAEPFTLREFYGAGLQGDDNREGT